MLIPILAAVLPALVLMFYVYHRDFNPEPVRLVVKGFGFGALATMVSSLISGPLMAMGYFTLEPEGFWDCIRVSFFGAAIPEECAKLLMLWLLLRNCAEFDERYDGIVYAVAVGLGFATLENIEYVLAAGADWFSVSVSRALFAVPGHFAFAVVMGYYYSLYHFYGESAPKGTKAKIILYPILLHGVYDSIVFVSNLGAGWSGILTLVLIYFCYRLFKASRERIRLASTDEDLRARIMRDSAPMDDAPDEQ
ncbi:MAG: PrsW family intramembrane metalloprotease [Bacteroidales bacterium]|nr:PrsW family intramembrane metalloprotease [Bacteroidales bacterium]